MSQVRNNMTSHDDVTHRPVHHGWPFRFSNKNRCCFRAFQKKSSAWLLSSFSSGRHRFCGWPEALNLESRDRNWTTHVAVASKHRQRRALAGPAQQTLWSVGRSRLHNVRSHTPCRREYQVDAGMALQRALSSFELARRGVYRSGDCVTIYLYGGGSA